MPAEEQVCVIYAGVRGFLDKMVTSEIPKFEQKLLEYIKANHSKVLDDIRK
jgi:F-type H+-transporting ATPase subunit alpha